MKKFVTTSIAAALIFVASAPATLAEEKKIPMVVPACMQDRSSCTEGYVTRPGITVADWIGAGSFERFIQRNGLEGYGITPETILPEGPITFQS